MAHSGLTETPGGASGRRPVWWTGVHGTGRRACGARARVPARATWYA